MGCCDACPACELTSLPPLASRQVGRRWGARPGATPVPCSSPGGGVPTAGGAVAPRASRLLGPASLGLSPPTSRAGGQVRFSYSLAQPQPPPVGPAGPSSYPGSAQGSLGWNWELAPAGRARLRPPAKAVAPLDMVNVSPPQPWPGLAGSRLAVAQTTGERSGRRHRPVVTLEAIQGVCVSRPF